MSRFSAHLDPCQSRRFNKVLANRSPQWPTFGAAHLMSKTLFKPPWPGSLCLNPNCPVSRPPSRFLLVSPWFHGGRSIFFRRESHTSGSRPGERHTWPPRWADSAPQAWRSAHGSQAAPGRLPLISRYLRLIFSWFGLT